MIALLRIPCETIQADHGRGPEHRGRPFLSESFGERACDVVVAQARLWDADLIGSHGRRGVGHLLIGSDAEQTVPAAPVPVLLFRPEPDATGVAAARETARRAPATVTA